MVAAERRGRPSVYLSPTALGSARRKPDLQDRTRSIAQRLTKTVGARLGSFATPVSALMLRAEAVRRRRAYPGAGPIRGSTPCVYDRNEVVRQHHPEAAPKSEAPEKVKKKNPSKTFWLIQQRKPARSATGVSERARTQPSSETRDRPKPGAQIEPATEPERSLLGPQTRSARAAGTINGGFRVIRCSRCRVCVASGHC
jgi:hypothetical protein